MKVQEVKRTLTALAACTLFAAVPASANIVLSFLPSAQHVNIGDTVFVDANISGFGAEFLSGLDVNFLYDGSIMGAARSADATAIFDELGGAYGFVPTFAFDSIAFGDWGFHATAVANDATVAANQHDSFLLAHFSFSADANGVTTFTLGLDPDQRKFVGGHDATGTPVALSVDIGSACIAVGTGICDATVPEPATLGLAAVAMLVGGAVGRNRRRARAIV